MNNTAPFSRPRLLTLAHTALAVGETRYARRLTLAWLAAFPGDLPVTLLHARALLQDGLATQAMPLLEGLCVADPEYLEAQEALMNAHKTTGSKGVSVSAGCVQTLGGKALPKARQPEWVPHLQSARQTLSLGDLDRSEARLHRALVSDPPTPLGVVLHLRLLAARQPALPAQSIQDIAGAYHKRWPACLPVLLYLAEALMDSGDHDHAVALLHQAAAQDVTGQVAVRLWGPDHPYRALWPNPLEIPPYGPNAPQEIPIPAGVAAALGLNQLSAGSAHPSIETEAPHQPVLSKLPPEPRDQRAAPDLRAAPKTPPPHEATRGGRFPAYIVLSTRRGLEVQYGEAGFAAIDAELHRLVSAVRARRGWDAALIYADDPQSLAAYKVQPAAHTDAWGIKRLLADLDSALAQRGERIGALLIAGGPGVVPFHHLPNPVDDVDTEVPSDNPYATRDENYFIPEWPVGRIPGDASRDSTVLTSIFKQICQRHQSAGQRQTWWEWLRIWIKKFSSIRNGSSSPERTLGYTAAIWRRASLSVYRAIGEPRTLLISPPLEAESAPTEAPYRLGYFNLHGIPDAVEWFGQRDPTEPGDQADYPVALRPNQIQNHGSAPEIVFSEACYGAHILNKTTEQALALKFLAAGTQAVVGSTCTSYGSIAMPLIAADLLGRAFWGFLRDGFSAGEALRRAKIALVREMHSRQGYLDGEDQKTLISFVLYGDPLAQPSGQRHAPKSAPEAVASAIPTVSDPGDKDGAATPSVKPIPPEVLAQVKHVVSHYLPGMADAQARLLQQASPAGKENTPGNKAVPAPRVVVLSKQISQKQVIHHHYARLKLDRDGKVVKVVISR